MHAFVEALGIVMDIGKLFFSAEGRIGRQEFWLGWLALFAIVTLTSWIPLIGFLVWVVNVYCKVCIYSKRLHDMGRSGWLQIWTYVPFAVATALSIYAIIGLIFAGVALREWPGLIAAGAVSGILIAGLSWIVAFLIDLGFLLWVGIADREPFDNRYGPAPLSPDYRDAMPIV